ncbi:MAG: putative 2-dehydropantoate 2-reductase [Synechococcaceae cyanobacterium SM2_3_1]|nr:putative 2-dehydropantoate 2-reductase [Synechococcaceae cyanobacterium SM2_3_1]
MDQSTRTLPATRRYAVLGTGALGGFYGARLQRASLEVHFLLHSDYEQVRKRGLHVQSCEGDFHLPHVHAHASVASMPPANVVIVALKAVQNHLLPEFLPSVVAEQGVVLLLQNGLGGEELIASILGPERVMGGLCFLCSNKVGPGEIHHLDYGLIQLADYGPGYTPQGITPRMQQIQADFERAGIKIKLSQDLLLSRWQKSVWNIPFNSLSVILNASTNEMMADPATRSLAQTIMREVVQGAAVCGRSISADFVEDMLARTERMQPYKTSMKLDFDHQRPLEVEAIVGIPLRMAQERGADLPRIEMLYQQLLFLSRALKI